MTIDRRIFHQILLRYKIYGQKNKIKVILGV